MGNIAHYDEAERPAWRLVGRHDGTYVYGPNLSLGGEVEVVPASQSRGAVEALAALYLIDRSTVARVCDEQADPSGRLLGVVRAAARGQ